jgi:hypothetical protein
MTDLYIHIFAKEEDFSRDNCAYLPFKNDPALWKQYFNRTCSYIINKPIHKDLFEQKHNGQEALALAKLAKGFIDESEDPYDPSILFQFAIFISLQFNKSITSYEKLHLHLFCHDDHYWENVFKK